MPIYEYYCSQCKQEFELSRPLSQSDTPAACPQCGGQAQKLLSVFASKMDYTLKVPEKGPYRQLPEAAPAASATAGNPVTKAKA